MTLFMIKVRVDEDEHDFPYDSIVAALEDLGLEALLKDGGTVEAIWAGDLRVTTRPIQTIAELKSQLVNNATVILRRRL